MNAYILLKKLANRSILMMAVLSSSYSFSNEPERAGKLSSKVILKDQGGFFILSDGSFWRAIEYKKRPRTFLEWLQKIILVPENYECNPIDWVLGSNIQVYPKQGYSTADEGNALNEDALKQCTHILVNAGNEQILFAVPLTSADCLAQVYQGARKEGLKQGDKNEYQKGYNTGLSRGRSTQQMNSGESYDKGYKDGYKEGFAKGTATCHSTEAEIYSEIYNKGHTDGFEFGFKEGYESASDDDEACPIKHLKY
ncbi:MAG: hypothetical protein A3E80_02695 [Chlamydiae bacterium RIFCSPHIGHO2_12_FULL_49_9]|nr:MAG: hypothetical protein A3E80_02695 [Chlamydiae bacterium RIFCSPHIGHO2_12_FULL_49_9]